jgi:hypothetical protein
MLDKREILPTFSELIEKLTVTQLRELFLVKDRQKNSKEIEALEHDIDLIIKEKDIKLTARLLRQVFVIAQINAFIWDCKDEMQKDTISQESYSNYLKKAHQLNGIRNQIRNLLLEITEETDKIALRSNINTDGLDYFISI